MKLKCTKCEATNKFRQTKFGIMCGYCGSSVEIEDDGRVQQATKEAVSVLESKIEQLRKENKELFGNLTSKKEEALGIAIYNLRNELDKPYPAKKLYISYAKEVKKYEPDHFLANIVEMIAEGQSGALNDYLLRFEPSTVPKNVLSYGVKILSDAVDNRFSFGLGNLIDRGYNNLDEWTEKKTYFEKETTKVIEGIYNCNKRFDIFIAHSNKDYQSREGREIIGKIISTFENRGYKCWISTRNLRHNIGTDTEYKTNIQNAIRNSTVFLFIGSGNSRKEDCEAYRVEIPYITDLDRETQPLELRNQPPEKWSLECQKMRVQYMLTDYNKPMNADERQIRDFFRGYNNCTSLEQLEDNVISMLRNGIHSENIVPTELAESTPTPPARQGSNEDKDDKYKEDLKRAEGFIIRKKNEKAEAIYEKILEEDPNNIDATVGYIKIITDIYTKYEGEEISEQIAIANEMFGEEELSQHSAEYKKYIADRNRYFIEKERAEQERAEQERIARENAKQSKEYYDEGEKYYYGRGVTQSYSKAIEYYLKAAEIGNAGAQCYLGYMYENGRGVEQSDTEAVKWYRKAADQGHVRAQCNLGWMYSNGRGVEQSDTEAVKWYRKAAEQGHTRAKARLKEMGYNT